MSAPVRFKSAIGGSFLVVTISAFMLGPLFVGVAAWNGKIPSRELPQIAALMLLPAVIIVVLYRATSYIIEGDTLIVKGGVVNATVPLDAVRTVRASRSIMSAPAFSFDRIEIVWNRFESVIISPDNKAAFVRAMRERCPRATFEGLDVTPRRGG